MMSRLKEAEKQIGVRVFSRCVGINSYRVLLHADLFDQLADLSDCAPLEDMRSAAVAGRSAAGL